MVIMKSYKHLEESTPTGLENILTRFLPAIAVKNPLTRNIILSMEKILIKGFEHTQQLKNYFRF